MTNGQFLPLGSLAKHVTWKMFYLNSFYMYKAGLTNQVNDCTMSSLQSTLHSGRRNRQSKTCEHQVNSMPIFRCPLAPHLAGGAQEIHAQGL